MLICLTTTHGHTITYAALVTKLETLWNLLQALKHTVRDAEAKLEANMGTTRFAVENAALTAAKLMQAQERAEAKKKKSKFSTVTVRRVVLTNLLPCPSKYAISKLEQKEFIEIYYHTFEGCTEVAATLRHTPDKTFSL